MYPNAGSVSTGLLGVANDISSVAPAVDFGSQNSLVLAASLAFLIPAFTAWRMKRIWHCSLFVLMAGVCTAHTYCSPAMSQKLVLNADVQQFRCSIAATPLITRAFFACANFCALQMAFLVMGPEDPHMQWLDMQTLSGNPSSVQPFHAPFDAVMAARVVPAVLLGAFHFHAAQDTEEIYWQSLLLNELLLVVCGFAFWSQQARRKRAADVLVRFKYWHRLLHHGFIPAMMLFWIFCIIGFADLQALHSMWHVVVALFATSLLRTVLLGESASPSAKVYDPSPHNPNVAHVLLGGVGLTVLPTSVIGASFDWCSTGKPHWPTIAAATVCQPGGYFVAIVAVPALACAAAVFWLINSTSVQKAWDKESAGCAGWQESAFNSHRREWGRRLGCFLGYTGVLFGLSAILIMRSSPIWSVMNLFCTVVSLGLIMIAMALTVLSADASLASFQGRRTFTMGACLPAMAFHMMLILVGQCSPVQYKLVPQSMYAITEYIILLLLSAWPLTWLADIQETWQHKTRSNFAWPTTTWRFGGCREDVEMKGLVR